MDKSIHIPVMIDEVIGGLNLKSGDSVVDATIGGGGHALEILRATAPDGKLLGIDWDKQAIARIAKYLSKNKSRVTLKAGNYKDIKKIAYESGISEISGILLDLGLSWDQLKDGDRGFSFSSQGALDMRFSDQEALTAGDIVNTWSENDLAHIFKTYGEERHAARAAQLIIAARKRAPILTVSDLVDVVLRGAGRRGRVHPATRIFQALRITTNRELENIELALPEMISMLKIGGRIAVITFHSLEDRIVKNCFKSESRKDNPSIKLINKKVIKPSREEVLENPASRSAKLRVVEKL
jgi:16S rRNA (cytosine1402-N4)-methyltransferase